MTVLSRGARVRRGGRRPGWVLLTTLLVLAIGASSALVFTNRVELLKLAVILALWAAVAGAFVSVMYRRQADADQARARDMKLVYDLQLEREISARREYELTVESQLRRELASELRGAAADEVAALRAELAALRTSLEILFDADLQQHPALENATQNGAQRGEALAADWVSSDRIRAVRPLDNGGAALNRADETAIIDVPEVRVPPPTAPPPPPPGQPIPTVERPEPAPQPEPMSAPRHRQPATPPPVQQPPPPQQQPTQPSEWRRPQPFPQPQPQPQPPQPSQPPQPQPSEWQPVTAEGRWLPPGAPGSNWAYPEPVTPPPPPHSPEPESFEPQEPEAAAPPPAPSPEPPPAPPSGRRRRRARDDDEDEGDITIGHPDVQQDAAPQYGGRRSRSRHSAEYRDFGVAGLGANRSSSQDEPPAPPAPPAAEPPPPPAAAAPAESGRRHRSVEEESAGSHNLDPQTGGQSVADLLARFQIDPSAGGRRRRRSG